MKTLTIEVPGSTSNLGPGFDLLGLALSLFVSIEATALESSDKHKIEAAENTPNPWPLEDNLVARAFDAVFQTARTPPPPQHFLVKSSIPTARGLGSSGAAVAAGLLLGEARLIEVCGEGLGQSVLHELGIAIEGHPDNVTASLFAGCTLCLPACEGPGAHATALVHQEVSSSLGFAVAWADSTLPTTRARQVLATEVSFQDAVENPRRLAMLLEGLRTGNAELLHIGCHDRLHHLSRLALIPGGREALAAADAAGAYMTAINGSGSSLVAVGSVDEAASLAAVLHATLDTFDTNATALSLQVVRKRPVVLAI